MATDTLIVNRDDFNTITSIDGNVDFDKITPHIITAQDMNLQVVLGALLYEKIISLIDNQEETPLVDPYKTLILEYIVPFLTHFTMCDYIPFQLFEISNSGIGRHQSVNSLTAEPSDGKYLIQLYKNKAEFYGQRLQDYLCANSTNFPEYNQSATGKMSSSNEPYFSGWQI